MKETLINCSKDRLDTSLVWVGTFHFTPIDKVIWPIFPTSNVDKYPSIESVICEKVSLASEREEFFNKLQMKYEIYCGREMTWKEKLYDHIDRLKNTIHISFEPPHSNEVMTDEMWKDSYEYLLRLTKWRNGNSDSSSEQP